MLKLSVLLMVTHLLWQHDRNIMKFFFSLQIDMNGVLGDYGPTDPGGR